jgi:hypothetical protein
VVLVVVPEGLLELLGDILDDILLGLGLRGHELLYNGLNAFNVRGNCLSTVSGSNWQNLI